MPNSLDDDKAQHFVGPNLGNHQTPLVGKELAKFQSYRLSTQLPGNIVLPISRCSIVYNIIRDLYLKITCIVIQSPG